MSKPWPNLGQGCFKGPMNRDTPGNKGPMSGWLSRAKSARGRRMSRLGQLARHGCPAP